MWQAHEKASKRILKNTVFLYMRSIISLILKLYTSRIVLDALGVENFGVYQVIGGLVTMFSFLNSTMAAATQRFLSYEIGIGDNMRIRKVFSTTINIHIILSVIIFLLVESIGLYFLNTKLDIGKVDKTVAEWVLHFTALSLVLTINSVPYNSLLISRENMSYFAYIDIIGEILKLLVGFSLTLFTSDKLIYYAVLMFVVALIVRLAYTIICHRKYIESHYLWIWDKTLLKKIASFSGWTTLSAISFMVKTQGITLILNIFLGPLLNAAMGIANQVNSAIRTFSQNFQMSFMPQIVKTYAREEYTTMNQLIFSGAKMSTYLLMALAGPVMLEINYLLDLWLITIPQHTNILVILILIESILQTMTCTGNTAVRATGKVMWYEIVFNGVELLALPIAILLLYINTQYYIPFLVIIGFTIGSSFIKLFFLKKLVPKFKKENYLINIFFKCTIFMILSLVIPSVLFSHMNEGIFKLLLNSGIYELIFLSCIILIGLNKQEKRLVISIIKQKIH